MTAKDVAEVYRFLERHPDLHTNGIRKWREIRDREAGVGSDDEAKVAQAIGKLRSIKAGFGF